MSARCDFPLVVVSVVVVLGLGAVAGAATPPAPSAGPVPTATRAVPVSAPPPTTLPDGHYWVRRQDPRIGHGTRTDGATTTTTLHTSCQPLDLDTIRDGARRQHTLGHLAFKVIERKTGLELVGPSLVENVPPVRLYGACTTALKLAAVYPERKACGADGQVTKICRGTDCAFSDGRPPLELGACEAEVTRLERLALRISTATHPELRRSLARLERLERTGGQLWTYEPDEERCEPITVRRGPGGQLTMREHYRRRAGGTVDADWTLSFEPLLQRAEISSSARSEVGPGAGGGIGRGGGTANLYLGKDALLLDATWLFFERQRCAQSS
jgi:hypothetical protein